MNIITGKKNIPTSPRGSGKRNRNNNSEPRPQRGLQRIPGGGTWAPHSRALRPQSRCQQRWGALGTSRVGFSQEQFNCHISVLRGAQATLAGSKSLPAPCLWMFSAEPVTMGMLYRELRSALLLVRLTRIMQRRRRGQQRMQKH